MGKGQRVAFAASGLAAAAVGAMGLLHGQELVSVLFLLVGTGILLMAVDGRVS